MEPWRRNLYVLWIGCFLGSSGTSMILPFLSVFVQELGVQDIKEAAVWSAMIFGSNHLMVTLTSPFWGRISDIYGQKLMLIRGGISMGILIIIMGFVTSPLQLLMLRILFGTVAGFMSISVALMAIETPQQHVGKVLGTLQTGIVSGQLLGPLFGGIMAETIGMRNSFYFTGTVIFLSTIAAWIWVKETKQYQKMTWFKKAPASPAEEKTQEPKKKPSLRDIVKQAPVLLTIMIATYLVNVSLQSVSPIITLYVKSMNITEHAEIISGLIFAASALGSLLAAPILGRLGDRNGHHTIMLVSLLLLALLNIPQALVQDPWSLLAIRFASGLCVGGLMPSISALLRSLSPSSVQGSVFGYNSSATSFGNVCGSFLGGMVSNYLGIGSVFYCVAGILLIYCVLMLPQFKALDRKLANRGEKLLDKAEL